MFKLRSNQKGFTLVEVIVVAVIVAVLAAVAIPLYLNYVNDSRAQTAASTAGSVQSHCAACLNGGNTITNNAAAGGGGNVTCSNGAVLNIPAEIIVTLSGVVTGSTVTAQHTAGGAVSAALAF